MSFSNERAEEVENLVNAVSDAETGGQKIGFRYHFVVSAVKITQAQMDDLRQKWGG